MNQLTTALRSAFVQGAINWGDPSFGITLALLNGIGAYDRTTTLMVSDISGGDVIGSSPLVARSVLGDGSADCADGSITATDGETYDGMVFYYDTGDPTTSPILGWYDTRDDSTPIAGTVTGGAVNYTINVAGLFRL